MSATSLPTRTAARTAPPLTATGRPQLNLVIVGHVDHGKSTVLGRLLADTGFLPEGRLEQIRAQCAANARPFEYAFLLDALKNEQSQGITIDTARCFFRTAMRDYIVNDAPGHIEFLKNMVTGAARAEAALLVIDAHEGVRENSRRHGYILSMLGIRQLAVLVNKMDLVDYREDAFARVRDEYAEFLAQLGVRPLRFIPISGREGANRVEHSPEMPWYTDLAVLQQVESFTAESGNGGTAASQPLRIPVQDVYKFTAEGDDRRIVAGTIETGTLHAGDELVFLPSGKTTRVNAIEGITPTVPQAAAPGESIGFTLQTQIYVRAGELACRTGEPLPRVATRFRATVFWMGRAPLVPGRRYKLKVGAARVPVELVRVLHVVDAGELRTIEGKQQVDRHDVAEVILETARPVAFDRNAEVERTSRFVIVDRYDIAGCGTVVEELGVEAGLLGQRVHQRERAWEQGLVNHALRAARNRHYGKFIVVVGHPASQITGLARELEKNLFYRNRQTYFLSPANIIGDLQEGPDVMAREEQIMRLGELARVITDSGTLFITALTNADEYDLEKLRVLNEPNELFVVAIGEAPTGRLLPHVSLQPDVSLDEAISAIGRELSDRGIVHEYEV